MTENHTRLFTLAEQDSESGSPVFISGGELFRDDAADSVKARVLLKNTSGKELSSVTVRIYPFDRDGRMIDFDTGYEHKVSFSGEGPHEFPEIMLPFMTRSFRAEAESAVYADGSTWEKGSIPEDPPTAEKGSEQNAAFMPDSCANRQKTAASADGDTDPAPVSESKAAAHPAASPKPPALTEETAPSEGVTSAVSEAGAQAAPLDSSGGGFSFRTLLVILIPAILILSGLAIIFTSVYVPEHRYNQAVELFNSGNLEAAIPALEAMNGYKDSDLYISTAKNALSYQAAVEAYEKGDYGTALKMFTDLRGFGDSADWAAKSKAGISSIAYSEADALLRRGRLFEAANAFYAIKDYSDSWDRCFEVWGLIAGRRSISAGSHTVCLTDSGKLLTAGDNSDGELDLSGWHDIAEVSAGNGFTVGLMPDGTVVAAGNNDYGQCDVSDWTDIVYVSAGYWSTAGIRADGTIVIAGRDCDVSGWSNVSALSASIFHTAGLLSDGSVVAAEIRDNTGAAHDYGQDEIAGWTDIVAISTGYGFTVGLKKDGTVVAAGDNTYGQCDVEDWEDIIAISANFKHVVGLKSDGTVVAAGWNENGECDVEDWEDIIAVSTGTSHTIGLKSDGTVVAVGNNKDGRCEVDDWADIRSR